MAITAMPERSQQIDFFVHFTGTRNNAAALKGVENFGCVKTAYRQIAIEEKGFVVLHGSECLCRVINDRFRACDISDCLRIAGIPVNINGNNRRDIFAHERCDAFGIDCQSLFINIGKKDATTNP